MLDGQFFQPNCIFIIRRFLKLAYINPCPAILNSQNNISQPLKQSLYFLFSKMYNNQHKFLQYFRLILVKPCKPGNFFKFPGEFKEKNACLSENGPIFSVFPGSD